MLVLPGRAADAAPGRGAVRGRRARRARRRRARSPAGAPRRAAAALARPLLARHAARRGRRARAGAPARRRAARAARRRSSAGSTRTRSLLVPRLLGGLPHDGERPDARDLLDAGEIDDELVAVRADDAGRAFVDWWTERRARTPTAAGGDARASRAAAARRQPAGRGARQPSTGVARLEDPAYDVSYWNLHERPLADARLVRFAGFRADRPWWLSEHALAHARARRPGAGRGVRARARRRCARPAGSSRPRARRRARAARRARLERAPAAPARAGARGRRGLRRHLLAGRRARVRALADDARASAARRPASDRYALDPGASAATCATPSATSTASDGEGYVALAVGARPRRARPRTSDLLPPPPAWARGADERPAGARHRLPARQPRPRRGRRAATRAALQAAGVPVGDVDDRRPSRRSSGRARRAPRAAASGRSPSSRCPTASSPRSTSLCVNAAAGARARASRSGEEALRSRYTIGQWAWETDAVPARWDALVRARRRGLGLLALRRREPRARDRRRRARRRRAAARSTRPTRAARRCRSSCPTASCSCSRSTSSRRSSARTRSGWSRRSSARSSRARARRWCSRRSTRDFRPEARERLRHAIGDRDDILLVDATARARPRWPRCSRAPTATSRCTAPRASG